MEDNMDHPADHDGEGFQRYSHEYQDNSFSESDDYETTRGPAGYTTFQATLSFISTIIGGGIISVPYAATTAGMRFGVLINFIILAVLLFATHLYLRVRYFYGFASLSELLFISFGRSSVFLINALLAFSCFNILVLYFVLFSKISLSLVENFQS